MKIRLIFSAIFAFTIAAYAQDTWTQLNSGTTQVLTGISCPTVNTCYTVGASIFKTANGGTDWISQGNTNARGWSSIYCPATDTCYTVGGGARSVRPPMVGPIGLPRPVGRHRILILFIALTRAIVW
jgi:hypothetical protein